MENAGFEVIEYKKGDERFKHPEYKKAISHVLLFMFSLATISSQLGMTLKILPHSLWRLTLGSFLISLVIYIWIYYDIEHRSGGK